MGSPIIGIMKIVLAVFLAPVVIACVLAVSSYFTTLPNVYQGFFGWGMMAFLVLFLFVYQFWGIFEFGQKLIQGAFRFLAPLEKYVAYCLPFYVIVTFVLFFITKSFFKTSSYDPAFIYFAGFFFLMHIVLTAQELQQQEESDVKWAYLLVMFGVFIVNSLILILLIDLSQGTWNLPAFIKSLVNEAKDLYLQILRNPFFSTG